MSSSVEELFLEKSKVFKNLPSFLKDTQIIEFIYREWELYVDEVATFKECYSLGVMAFSGHRPIQTSCVEFHGEWEEGLKHNFKLELANVCLAEVPEVITYWGGAKNVLRLKKVTHSPMGEMNPFILHNLDHVKAHYEHRD